MDHPQTMIKLNAHNYYSSCFYQLLDYDFFFSIFNSVQFINSSAAEGGDHIYGVSLENACICALVHHLNSTHMMFSSVAFSCSILGTIPHYQQSQHMSVSVMMMGNHSVIGQW